VYGRWGEKLRISKNQWYTGDDRKIKVIVIHEQKPKVITYSLF
jgi:hypothetical protein